MRSIYFQHINFDDRDFEGPQNTNYPDNPIEQVPDKIDILLFQTREKGGYRHDGDRPV